MKRWRVTTVAAMFLVFIGIGCSKKFTTEPIGPQIINTPTHSLTPTITNTPTVTTSTTNTPTQSLTRTPTVSLTHTNTPSFTNTHTITPQNIQTMTPTPSETFTPTDTFTLTETPTPTFTPTPHRDPGGLEPDYSGPVTQLSNAILLAAGEGSLFVFESGRYMQFSLYTAPYLDAIRIRGPPSGTVGADVNSGEIVSAEQGLPGNLLGRSIASGDQTISIPQNYSVGELALDGLGTAWYLDVTNKRIIRAVLTTNVQTEQVFAETPRLITANKSTHMVHVLFNDDTIRTFDANNTSFTPINQFPAPSGIRRIAHSSKGLEFLMSNEIQLYGDEVGNYGTYLTKCCQDIDSSVSGFAIDDNSEGLGTTDLAIIVRPVAAGVAGALKSYTPR
jgi:hypothetical protein